MLFLTLHIGAIAPVYVRKEICDISNERCVSMELDIASMIFAGLGTVHGFPTLYIDNYA